MFSIALFRSGCHALLHKIAVRRRSVRRNNANTCRHGPNCAGGMRCETPGDHHPDSATQDDPGRLAGLEKSLDHVNAHCKDTNLTKQRNRKVIKAQVRVNEAQHALDQAQTEQRSETKLAKLRAKLDSAKAELADAEAALKQ